MARFAKGQSGNKRGRKPGVPNKITTVFRQAVLGAYEELGGHEFLVAWAKKNQTEFFKIMARLIPSEVAVSGEIAQHFVAELPAPAADADEWVRQCASLSSDRNQIN